MFILAVPALFAFCYNLNNADVEYSLEIQGLAGVSAENHPVILLVPLPLMNDQPAFSNASFTVEFDGWNSSVVLTEYGPMLSFTSVSSPLKNLRATYGRYNMFVDDVPVSTLAGQRFSPETAETTTPYSLHDRITEPSLPVDTQIGTFPPSVIVATRDPSLPAYQRGPRYSSREDIGPTLVYIPDTLYHNISNLSIFIEYQTRSKYGNLFTEPNNMRGYYTTVIIEQIPGNISGWIPVRPQSYPVIRLNNFPVS
ncbi:hypothetical protein [Methanorbis furvi]|uniref:hypothetical protein n=1 Tax=Methanorbis furvi TaxID=3028299 RepID=UPI0030B8CF22